MQFLKAVKAPETAASLTKQTQIFFRVPNVY